MAALPEELETQNSAPPPPPGGRPPPFSLKEDLQETFRPLRDLVVFGDDPFEDYKAKTVTQKLVATLFWLFPILEWASTYKLEYLAGDVIGGLTITSLAVPQDLAYAVLAGVGPVYGLYGSFVPPLVYSVLGTSRQLAIGLTSVVALPMASLVSRYVSSTDDPSTYLQLTITATFFSGVLQLGMGVLRLGWLIEYLSHAAVLGFMSGVAITISLAQLRGLLGYKTPNNSTDIVSTLTYVFQHTNEFNWRAFTIGMVFLVFLFGLKFLAWWFQGNKRLGKPFYFANALGPFVSVFVSTLAVYLTHTSNQCCGGSSTNCSFWDASVGAVAKCTGTPGPVPCVTPMPKGVSNLGSANMLLLTGNLVGPAAATGVVVGFIGLTEAIVISRTFAIIKGYHVDGNKEMIAYGMMNIAGSLTSSIITTGSLSRSSVNSVAGANTMLSNIIMALLIVVVLVSITQVFVVLPTAVLSAIVICAVLSLIDFKGIWKVWKADKIDVLVLLGTFFGVVFVSVEIGLLIGIAISIARILLLVTRPQLAVLGAIEGTGRFQNLKHFPEARAIDGVLLLRVDAPLIFTNANYIRERVINMAERYQKKHEQPLTHVVLDVAPVPDIDTTALNALEELNRVLQRQNVQMCIAGASKLILRRMCTAGIFDKIGEENIFPSVHDAYKSHIKGVDVSVAC